MCPQLCLLLIISCFYDVDLLGYIQLLQSQKQHKKQIYFEYQINICIYLPGSRSPTSQITPHTPALRGYNVHMLFLECLWTKDSHMVMDWLDDEKEKSQ